MDITKMVKDAVRYRVKKLNDSNRGCSGFDRFDTWTALDELRRSGFDLKLTDTEWVVTTLDWRDRSREVEVARFRREKAQRKTCMCYMDVMPRVPRISV